MKKSFALVPVLICFVFIAAGGWYCWGHSQNNDSGRQINDGEKTVHSMAMKSIFMTNEQKEEYFQKWVAPSKDCFSDIEEARKIVPYPIKFPDQKITGPIEEIYVNKSDNPEEKDVYIRYEGGYNNISLSICYRSDKPDLVAHAQEIAEEMEKGICYGDKAPKVLELNGLPIWTAEPGYNVLEEQKFPRPGIVEWWDNGVFYTLVGTSGEQGTSVEKLMEIAKTILTDSTINTEDYPPIERKIIPEGSNQTGPEEAAPSEGEELEK